MLFRSVGKLKMLAYIADPIISGNEDLPLIGLGFPRKNPQEGGLSMPVSSHKANAFARVDLEADIIKKILVAITFFEVFNLYHLYPSMGLSGSWPRVKRHFSSF